LAVPTAQTRSLYAEDAFRPIYRPLIRVIMSFCSIAVQESSADGRPVDRSDRAMTSGLTGEPILYADTSADSE